jgi:hypothetical protein
LLSLDSSIVVRRKVVFLLLILLLQDGPSVSQDEIVSLPPSIHTTLPAPLPSENETSTNGEASKNMAKYGILLTILKSLVLPIPHGPNGEENAPDADYEEKCIEVVMEYARLGVVPMSEEEQTLLVQAQNKIGKKSGV